MFSNYLLFITIAPSGTNDAKIHHQLPLGAETFVFEHLFLDIK